MTSLIYHILFLAVFFLFLTFSISKLLESKPKKYIKELLLVIAGLLIVFYIRAIVFCNSFLPFGDERKYVEILNLMQAGISHPVSGLGYVNSIALISKITQSGFEKSSIYFSVIISILSLFVIYVIYKKNIKDKFLPSLSIVLLLITSYFIYPAIEARPQQLGMILVFISSLIFYNYLNSHNWKNLLFFSLFYLFTFYYHILSFVLLTFIILFIYFWELLNKKVSIRQIVIPAILLIICSLFYFMPGSGYERNKQDIIDISIGLWPKINTGEILIILSVLLIFLLAIVLFFGYLSSFENKNKKLNAKLIVSAFAVSILALASQFYLNKESYFNFYNNSFFYFLLFQAGNIFFGIFYILGAKHILENSKKQGIFFKSSVSLLILGILVLMPSFFLDARLNNIFIRILNYWAIFAAPVAANSLKKIIKNKNLLAALIAILAIISIINASRNPLFFNYKG